MFGFFRKNKYKKNKIKKIAFVDYENFHNLELILKAKFDLVKLFVGYHQDKVLMPALEVSTNIEIIKVTKCDKNSLDCILSAECGIFFEKYKKIQDTINIFIFSSDKGFDALISKYKNFNIKRIAKEYISKNFIEETKKQISNLEYVYKLMLSDKFRTAQIRKSRSQKAKDLLIDYLEKYYYKDLDVKNFVEYLSLNKAIGFSNDNGCPVFDDNRLKTVIDNYLHFLSSKLF
ncbi:PIN domain-containing protein [Francisella sp. LA112445]|uniref:PIN domain-containing protein n=1 Tax=Francisella sp. LA112445 TaxID=1395624 RepID=UPI001788D71A|nr:PIN domain-containing protein [Francisella sp. LA112445]QIW10145.1 hypothetical protein FIP56_05360 [Francisella sp. LA112445]